LDIISPKIIPNISLRAQKKVRQPSPMPKEFKEVSERRQLLACPGTPCLIDLL
jgi:hypothetical protein